MTLNTNNIQSNSLRIGQRTTVIMNQKSNSGITLQLL